MRECPFWLSEVSRQICGGSGSVRRTQQGRPLSYFGSPHSPWLTCQGLSLGLQRLQNGRRGSLQSMGPAWAGACRVC